MRVVRHFLKESKNVYYRIPSNKSLLLIDFYALELARFYAFSKNDIFQDETNKTNVVEAERILLPFLQKNLTHACFVSMFSELSNYSLIRNKRQEVFLKKLDPNAQKIFLELVSAYERAQGKSSIKTTSAQSNTAFDPSNRTHVRKVVKLHGLKMSDAHVSKYNMRKYAVDAGFAILNRYGSSRVLNLLIEIFKKYAWPAQYGGVAWENIALKTQELNQTRYIPDLYLAIDGVYQAQHNTGSVFNKILEYLLVKTKVNHSSTWMIEPESLAWMRAALDMKYEGSPFEIANRSSSNMRSILLPILQKTRVSRSNLPKGYTINKQVEFYPEGKVVYQGLFPGLRYYIVAVDAKMGTIKVHNAKTSDAALINTLPWVNPRHFDLI